MFTEARQQAAQLIEAVLDERLDADAALLHWPRVTDGSLQAAYQALLHFSVDRSGYHQTEPLYADVQLRWLGQMVAHLKAGQPLPAAMALGYKRTTRFYWKPPGWWVAILSGVEYIRSKRFY